MKNKLSFMGILAIMIASSLTIMVGSAITPALPEVGEHFGIMSASSWLVTTPALGVVVCAIIFGQLIDKEGPYYVIMIGLILYGTLGVIGFLMPNVIDIFIDRFLLGAATAAVMTSSTALISKFYNGEKQLKMVAIQGMAIELGGVIFLSVGGFLAEVSWKGPFFIYCIAFVAFILMILFVPNVPEEEINHKVETERANNEVKKSVYPALVLAFVGMLVFFSSIVTLPMYLQKELGYSSSFTGNFLAFISLIAVIFAGVMPKVVKKIQARGSLTIAFFSYCIAHFIFFEFSSLSLLFLAAIFMGIGFGFSTPLINNLTVDRSTSKNKGKNLSFYSMAIFSGQFLSSLVQTVAGGKYVFIVASIISCIVAITIFTLFDKESSNYDKYEDNKVKKVI